MSASPESEELSSEQRRRWQFSLRRLLVLTVVVAAYFGTLRWLGFPLGGVIVVGCLLSVVTVVWRFLGWRVAAGVFVLLWVVGNTLSVVLMVVSGHTDPVAVLFGLVCCAVFGYAAVAVIVRGLVGTVRFVRTPSEDAGNGTAAPDADEPGAADDRRPA